MNQPRPEVENALTDDRKSDNATKSTGKKWRTSLSRLFMLASLAYLFVLGCLMFFERRLIYPAPDPALGDWNPPGLVFEDVWLKAADGTKLNGWYLPHDSAKRVMLYFHGNGEHLPWSAPDADVWRTRLNANVLVMDYRGYGKSEGQPSEPLLIQDGVKAAKWLASRNNIKPSDLVLWGRSIGGGVAAGVAQQIDPQAVVMESTFDSLADVAASHVRWFPVRRMMTNQYPSAKRLADFEGVYLQWHGMRDPVVPFEAGRRLYDAVASPSKWFIEAPKLGHNDAAPEEFRKNVMRYLPEAF